MFPYNPNANWTYCQNIENSNSILNMKQGSGGGKKNKTSSSEEQGDAAEIITEDQIYDDRTIDVRKHIVAIL